MKKQSLILLLSLFGCNPIPNKGEIGSAAADSVRLVRMVQEREQAMIAGDLTAAMAQFADDATWINSQGYFFEGKREVERFHAMLAGNDSLAYGYEAGTPRVRVLSATTAVAYYSWKMTWYRKATPADTTYREIGLMTLLARKDSLGWRWVAVTNQHTPEYSDVIEAVSVQ